MNQQSDADPSVGIMDRVARVSDRVEIRNVYLEDSQAKRADEASFARGGMKLEYEHTPPQVIQGDSPKQFGLRVSFNVTATPDEPAAKSVLKVQATFILEYSLSDIEGITPLDLTAFGLINGAYNAWPYWREFLQNTTTRMGLPPITAPVFRLSDALANQAAVEDKPAIDSEGSSGG